MSRHPREGWRLLAAALLLAAAPARAERQEPLPPELEGVGIVERPGAKLPLELEFTDESGRRIALGEYFEDGRPVILTLNYYRCPMLCTVVLDGLVDAMKELSFTPGREYRVVTVSIDPLETPTLARHKKQAYVEACGREEAGFGWHFLTGPEAAIRRLADAAGFGYRFVPERREYAHAAAIFVVTPQGRLSRTLYGVRFEPQTLRLSLVEAGEGRTGSALDRFILYCFHYDAAAGRYAPAALRIMRMGGAATVLALGALVGALWVRETRRRRSRLG